MYIKVNDTFTAVATEAEATAIAQVSIATWISLHYPNGTVQVWFGEWTPVQPKTPHTVQVGDGCYVFKNAEDARLFQASRE